MKLLICRKELKTLIIVSRDSLKQLDEFVFGGRIERDLY